MEKKTRICNAIYEELMVYGGRDLWNTL